MRLMTSLLPTSIITLFYRLSRRLFHWALTPARRRSLTRKHSRSSAIRDAPDFVDLCALSGYLAEEHVVQTTDGYLLCLHRLAWKRGEEEQRTNSSKGGVKKPVIYLHHGLMMNSEIWVCLTDEERCLVFKLVDMGYDVWLGNNRGNKYSKKSIHHPPTSPSFWNFSMDEFAFHDIPDSINYILSATSQPSLSYIGFSQGTAQAFATLSIHPKLNDKVNVFIALAPAMSPAGLSNGIVDSLMKTSPQILYLLFGRRAILSSTAFWQSILYPPIFVKTIDVALDFLFGWKSNNMSMAQKLAAYPHLYSFTSVKSVVHWFQIIRTKSFQMHDDDVQTVPILGSGVSKYTRVAKFPTRNIKTPCVLVYGGSDSLVDIDVMLRQLPKHTVATEIPHYEHLDFLWGRDVDKLVFPHVFDALEAFSDSGHSKEHFKKFKAARDISLHATPEIGGSYADVVASNLNLTEGDADTLSVGTETSPLTRKRGEKATENDDGSSSSFSQDPNQNTTARATEGLRRPTTSDSAASGTAVGSGSESPSQGHSVPMVGGRKGRKGSNVSFDSTRFGTKGISLGVGKPIGGVSLGSGEWEGVSSDTDASKTGKVRKKVGGAKQKA